MSVLRRDPWQNMDDVSTDRGFPDGDQAHPVSHGRFATNEVPENAMPEDKM